MSMSYEELRANFEEEKGIVNRIWDLFGSPSYADLRGRSIYDLIKEIQAENTSLKSRILDLERDGERLDLFETQTPGEGFDWALYPLDCGKVAPHVSSVFAGDIYPHFATLREAIDGIPAEVARLAAIASQKPDGGGKGK